MVFLDTSAAIYLIEQPPLWGPKVTARIAALLAGGEQLAVSDLIRMECQVGPLKAGDSLLLAKFVTFFASPDVQVLPVSGAVCDRAARIRAGIADALPETADVAAANSGAVGAGSSARWSSCRIIWLTDRLGTRRQPLSHRRYGASANTSKHRARTGRRRIALQPIAATAGIGMVHGQWP